MLIFFLQRYLKIPFIMEREKRMAVQITSDLQENISQFEELFSDCADIKKRKVKVGQKLERECYIAYIEVAVSSTEWKDSAVGKILQTLRELPEEKLVAYVEQNVEDISDSQPFATIEDAAQGMLTGDVLFFLEGYDRALKIPDKGYPGRGVYETESEKVIRGSNEGFSESIKLNTALIRKRLRSPHVKVKESFAGKRTHTNVDLVYMKDLIYPGMLEEVEKRLGEFEIDGALDSGII